MFAQIWSSILLVVRFLYVALSTLPRDLYGLFKLIRHHLILKYNAFRKRDFVHIFRENVRRYGAKPCFVLENKTLSFQQVEDLTNQLANYFSAEGYQRGDVIALLMENALEYPCVWIGLSKIGCITALINTNQRAKPLLHSLQTVNAKALITSKLILPEIQSELQEVNLKKVYLFDPKETKLTNGSLSESSSAYETVQLYEQFESCSTQPPKKLPYDAKHPVFYIFTSGTTGLPKAAVIKHARLLLASYGFICALSLKPDDIMYNPLPLYHSLGGWVCVTHSLLGGCTTILRKKFSASNFWKDCIKYKCTGFTYVGELLRFILAQPPSELDQKHSIRFCTGNGLRKNLWMPFSKRFNISNIYEFYGATESNAYFFNITGYPGACGFFSVVLPHVLGSLLVRYDPETMEPLRDTKTNLCIECKTGERGLLLGMIQSGVHNAYDGYVNNPTGTKKKIVENVMRNGDRAFNTGDVMYADKFGYFYFCDRTGDTFRWKGENVSTVEVENILMNIFKKNDTIVFGVAIPETDGKAGMAVILDDSSTSINMSELVSEMKKLGLPSYARPCFVRLTKHIELTGTFKVKKTVFQDEGFDVTRVSEPIYYLNQRNQTYEKLTPEVYQSIVQQKIQF